MSLPSPITEAQPRGYEGRTLGGYHLIREIACGDMATVYLGHKSQHAGIGQVAAVKVIHPHLARDTDFVDMFLDEARIVSFINHPNVCRVLDFGKSDGTYYLAMEYVMGETWADVAARLSEVPEAESMYVPVLAQVLAQACEGLHAAHDAEDAQGNPLNIVHRDISPHNIMVGYDGSVRVLDFGIASATERLHTTRNGAVKGRLSYMAPEQMRGQAVDRRADVWSLGVVLWEGLARQRLFRRDNEAKTVLAVTQEPVPTLGQCGQLVSGTLQRIVTRALERDRGIRYGSARELGLELSRCAVKSLVPVGMPEVSKWMHLLFAKDIEQKRAALREAAKATGPYAAVDSSSVEAESPKVDAQQTRPVRSEVRATSSSSGVRPISFEKSRRIAKAAPLAAVLLAVLGLGFWAWPRTERAEPAKPAPAAVNAASQSARPAAPSRPAASAAAEEAAEAPTKEANADLADPAEADATLNPADYEMALDPELDLEFGLDEVWGPEKAKRKPHPQPGEVKIGQVSIATPGGWADVYLGDRKLGTTPVRLLLPEGVRTLRLVPFGEGPDILRHVTVDHGVMARLKVPLN